MKKGVFPLILSFVLGITFLLFYLLAYSRSPLCFFATRPFEFLSHTLILPDLQRMMPGYFLTAILALLMNLLAMIVAAPSFAVGAAVLYAVSVGLNPDLYPYVTLEFLLCLFAAARLRSPEEEELHADLADQLSRKNKTGSDDKAYVHHYADGSAASSNVLKSSRAFRSKSDAAAREMEAQKKAAAKAMRMQGSSAASASVQTSYEALRAQEVRESHPARRGPGFFAVIAAAVILCMAATILVSFMGFRRSRQGSVTRETAFTSTGKSTFDANLKDNGHPDDSGHTVQNSNSGGTVASGSDTSKPLDLTGDWCTDPGQTSGTRMAARITEDKISVYWLNEDGSAPLYWAGKYQAPTSSAESYSWLSMTDIQDITFTPFISKERMKSFTYYEGTLSFPMTTMGIKLTIRMHRSEERLPIED